MKQNIKLNTYATYLVLLLVSLTSLLSYLTLNQLEKLNRVAIQQVLETFLLTSQEAENILLEEQRITALSIVSSDTTVMLTSTLLNNQHLPSDEKEVNQNNSSKNSAFSALERHIKMFLAKHGKGEFHIISPEKATLASSVPIKDHRSHIMRLSANNRLTEALLGNMVFIPAVKVSGSTHSMIANNEIRHAMYWLAPIKQDQKVIAILALRIDPRAHFTKITSYTHIGKSGETIAINAEGQILTAYRDSHLNPSHLIFCDNFAPRNSNASTFFFGENTCSLNGYQSNKNTIFAAVWNSEYQYGLITSIHSEEAFASYNQTQSALIQVISLTTSLCVLILIIIHLIRKRFEKRILIINQQLETRVKQRTIALEKAKAELSIINRELKILAITDNLTGLFNKRHYDTQLAKEWQRCMRYKQSIAMLMFDIDFFKQFNDHYGHQAGDDCLKKLGEFLLNVDINRRPGDVIARYGGEEFIVLLTAPSFDYCRYVAQKLCDGIRALNIPHKGSKLANTSSVTVSVGCAITTDVKQTTPDKLLNQADKALYIAKEKGRDRIYIYREEPKPIVTSLKSNGP